MDETLSYLLKRLTDLHQHAEELEGELAHRLEQENARLERVEFGDRFDGEESRFQEVLVGALDEAAGAMSEGRAAIGEALKALRAVGRS